MGLDSTQGPPKSYLVYFGGGISKPRLASIFFFPFFFILVLFSHGIVGMVALILCDQGIHGLVACSTRQKIIPERRTVWGDMEDHSCFMYISREKGGLWTMFRLLSSVGGAVLVGMAHGDGW
ncbi:hypothetical protein V8C42DRAFT_172301 [Trichoderma barbatum]